MLTRANETFIWLLCMYKVAFVFLFHLLNQAELVHMRPRIRCSRTVAAFYSCTGLDEAEQNKPSRSNLPFKIC